jgi:F-type H+-transporting ATPase subunit delta
MAHPTPASTTKGQEAIDPRTEQLGMVYAKAFLGAAAKAGQTEALLEQLDSLVVDVLDAFPDWERALASGLIDADEKALMLDRALGGQASPVLLNFLKVLARHERMGALRAVRRMAHQLYNEEQGRVPVYVRTAVPLSDGLTAKITQSLRAMVGGEPELIVEHDPELIAGLVLRVGDTVYDGSVWSQLEQMRAHMIDRSVHEIQSRRDRFRHSGGN